MPLLKKRKEDRKAQLPLPPLKGAAPAASPVVDPLVRSRGWAVAVSQLIDAAMEVTDARVGYRVTPLLSGVTVSWERKTLPSRYWLRDLEQEIITYGICNGLQVWFREF